MFYISIRFGQGVLYWCLLPFQQEYIWTETSAQAGYQLAITTISAFAAVLDNNLSDVSLASIHWHPASDFISLTRAILCYIFLSLFCHIWKFLTEQYVHLADQQEAGFPPLGRKGERSEAPGGKVKDPETSPFVVVVIQGSG